MGLGHGPNIVKDGLVFNIDAANPRSYPGSGTVIDNMVGTEVGSLNGATYSTDGVGSLNFDGIDDYITINGFNNITVNTISAWFKFSFSGNNVVMEKGSNAKMMFQPSSAGTTIVYANLKYYNGGAGYASSVMDGTWKNWVQIEDTDFSYFYINGILQNSQANTSNVTRNHPLVVMARSGGSYAQQGNVGPMQIYNRALSLSELTQNYNALKPRFN
tara:strand:- start:239 stop:886 length:648 start_codon:yes stop_codon:yes gene_type:complete